MQNITKTKMGLKLLLSYISLKTRRWTEEVEIHTLIFLKSNTRKRHVAQQVLAGHSCPDQLHPPAHTHTSTGAVPIIILLHPPPPSLRQGWRARFCPFSSPADYCLCTSPDPSIARRRGAERQAGALVTVLLLKGTPAASFTLTHPRHSKLQRNYRRVLSVICTSSWWLWVYALKRRTSGLGGHSPGLIHRLSTKQARLCFGWPNQDTSEGFCSR